MRKKLKKFSVSAYAKNSATESFRRFEVAIKDLSAAVNKIYPSTPGYLDYLTELRVKPKKVKPIRQKNNTKPA